MGVQLQVKDQFMRLPPNLLHQYIVAVASSECSPYDWQAFVPAERAVIVFVRNRNHVLLIHKKRGLGAGKVNGPGGRLEPRETPEEAAIRETHEEVGLQIADLHERAHLQFAFLDGYLLEVYVFVTRVFQGTLVETDEALPFWCHQDEIPYDKMWADDALWLPHALNGRRVWGRFVFDQDEMRWHEVNASFEAGAAHPVD
jgi:8-oxo-dGTP diphosphatase